MSWRKRAEPRSWNGDTAAEQAAGDSGGDSNKNCDHKGATTFYEEFVTVTDSKGKETRRKIKHNSCSRCLANWDTY